MNPSIKSEVSPEAVADALRSMDVKAARLWVRDMVLHLDSDLYHCAGQAIAENPMVFTECRRCHRMTDRITWIRGFKCEPHCEYCGSLLP